MWLEKSLMKFERVVGKDASERSAISNVDSTMRSRLRLPVVAQRIGGAKGRAGASRQFVKHIASRRREGFQVARGVTDVVVAREYPKLRALAPIARIFVAEYRVIGKRVRADQRRIKVERLHFHKTPGTGRKL